MKILHLIDSLNSGGAERMAVSYVNVLAEQGVEAHLWATREEGLLKGTLKPEVHYRFLKRKGPVGFKALFAASRQIKKENIRLIHAHSTSWFFGTLLKWLNPSVKLVWHDHYGKSEELGTRKKGLLKYCSRYFNLIFSVNQLLENWANKELKCKEVVYIRNFSNVDSQSLTSLKLQGDQGTRIICVANLRPQKNHLNLLSAFLYVTAKNPDWTLHLLGKNWEDDCFRSINTFIKKNMLENSVFYYGSQSGITALLKQADIGVLASDSEGLPLAIIEYALAGLPVVTTDVGFCGEVIQENGKLVPPGDAEALASALLEYIQQPQLRQNDARLLKQHVLKHYTEAAVMPLVLEHYSELLSKK